MTYNDFLNGIYWRPIEGMNNHEISNKGQIRNTLTGSVIKHRYNYNKNSVFLSEKGKAHTKVIWIEVLKAFPDVEFSNKEIRKFCNNHKIKRGAYKWFSKWRSVISFQGEKKTLGYFKTRKDAYHCFNAAYLMLRGFRPW